MVKNLGTYILWTILSTSLVLQVYAQEEAVVVYRKAHYQGVGETIWESDPDLADNRIGVDSVRSIKVPEGCTVTLFEDRGYRGRQIVLRRSHFDLRRMDFARRASSILVEWRPGTGPVQEILLFSESQFKGVCERLNDGDPNLADNPIGVGLIGSARIPAGWKVTLYSRPFYRGQSVQLSASQADLNTYGRVLPRVASVGISRPAAQRNRVAVRRYRPERRPPVILYQDSKFRGRSEEIFTDDPNLSDNRIGNDKLSSIQIPRGVVVTLYEDTHYRGDAVVLEHSQARLGRTPIGNDRVSSIRIEWPRQETGITLFQHEDFRGRSETFSDSVPDLDGTYIGNDSVSSIQVPPGYQVILFSDSRYRGRSEVFRGDDPDLANNRIGNDRVSSIRIERIPVRRR